MKEHKGWKQAATCHTVWAVLTCMARGSHEEEMHLSVITFQPLTVIWAFSNSKTEIANSSSTWLYNFLYQCSGLIPEFGKQNNPLLVLRL